MLKKFLLIISILFFGCTYSPNFFETGNHLLWKVSDENSSVWIFGSIHYGDSSFYPLPKLIEDAFKNSDALAVELDVSDETVNETTASEFQELGMLENGKNLREILSDSLWNELKKSAKQIGVSEQIFLPMRPWMAATMLSALAIASTGVNPELGIDQVLLDSAALLGKEIISIETPKEQVESLANTKDSSDALGIEYLAKTLEEVTVLDSLVQGLLNAWKNADIYQFRNLISTSDKLTESDKEFEKRIYFERNEKMSLTIEKFLEENKKVFVVVGLGHIIYGEKNVLELLKKRGYSIQKF